MAAAIVLFGVVATAVTATLDARAQDRVVAAAADREADLVAAELVELVDRHAGLVADLGDGVAAAVDDAALARVVAPVVTGGDLLPDLGRDAWVSLAVARVDTDGELRELGRWRTDAGVVGPTRVDARRVDVLGRDLVVRLERLPLALATPWRGRATVWLLGLGLTGLLAALVLLVGRSERRAFELAERQTAALQASNRELEQAVRDLEQASQAKDDFLAVVSHEFRTPLTVIQGFASTVLHVGPDELHPTTTEALLRIERHARRLDGLVGDLLTTAQLANGVVAARPEAVDVAAAVHDLVELLDDRGLELDVADGQLARVDRRHLDTIVANLVGNARKYGAPPVRLEVRPHGTDVEIAVTDAGDGVPDHLHDTLFDRFTQGEQGTTRSVSGVGLGLSIVRQLAELNDGTVRHEVPEGGGARFVVALRAAPTARRSVRAVPAASAAVPPGGGAPVPSS